MDEFFLKYVVPPLSRYLDFSKFQIDPENQSHFYLHHVYLRRPIGPFSVGSYFRRGNIDLTFTDDTRAIISVEIPLYIPKPLPTVEPGETEEENIENIDDIPTAYIINPLIYSLLSRSPYLLDRFNDHLRDFEGRITLPQPEITPAEYENIQYNVVTIDLSPFLDFRFQITPQIIYRR